ncbi:polysaccharide biosynthesis tyrosine autokinase [Pseudaminobacter soli (ex Li et al. 2025)]|uniref:non-specific protein-tyrosine kinase n=1 Tax=Pseudaminobacter soli (ex Li et al. 2025) TaxID=1295366 RepID=A0A2P7SGL9_9HYPH|nr:polysaccharide biosynthesis tyrosine autokinase [Mesorhizobium soli]PSJ61628.1 chain-length determining protein [Mesorhizobium soli]
MHQKSFPLSSRLSVAADDTDRFIDLERLASIALRQARVVAIGAGIGLALGAAYLVFTPGEYTAATRILLDDSLTKFAEDKSPAPAAMQADAMISSEVEILKSARLARTVAVAQKLQDNDAFLNPPSSPIAWLKDQVKAVTGLFLSAPELSPTAAENARIGKASALLQSGLNAERVGRSYVIEVSFRANDRQLAGAIARAYADAYLSDQLDANFDATQRATVWLQGRLAELRDSSQAAAMEVERFRAEHGLTSARGQLISEQQLGDLNSQLIVAQADTANALARYNQFKAIVDGGPENAVKNATIPTDKGANSAVINDLKARYLGVSKRQQEIAARFGEAHAQAVALRREQTDLARQIFQELQQLTESYRNEYEVAKSRETSLRDNVGQMAGQSSEAGQSLVQLRELEQKSAALSSLYQTFLARHEEASQQRSFPIAKARVISEAGDPVSPSSPRKALVLGLSLVLGLFGGAAAGALREFRERFFRTGDDVRSALDANFLGYLPIVGSRLSNSNAGSVAEAAEPVTPRILRVAINAPSSSFAETLRNVKLASDVVLQGRPCKVIGFVSVLPHEGKTTVAANFAGLLAANGARTLLIDADLRNPGLSRGLSLAPDKGLVEAIVGEQRWQSTVMVDRTTRLAIIPAVVRRRLSHTSELLSGPGMQALMEEASASYDYVVVDLPPLGPVVDAKAFAPFADGFVMVTEWGATPRALVRATLQAEPQIADKMLGVVLNKTDTAQLPRYGAFGGAEHYLERYSSYYVEPMGAKA